jgi:hypothetical protein
MGNGVIIPPHDFKQQSRYSYEVQEVTKYEFGVVTYGFTSINHFIKILEDIMLLNAYRQISQLVGVTGCEI